MALRQLDSEQITIDDTVGGVGLDASKITPNVIMALIGVRTAGINVDCKNAPLVDAGMGYASGSQFEIWGQPDLVGFRAIADSGTDAEIDVQYFGSSV